VSDGRGSARHVRATTPLSLPSLCDGWDSGLSSLVERLLTRLRVLSHTMDRGALECGVGCTTLWLSYAILWYCSWGYTPRLGGLPREVLVSLSTRPS
jgi:hypothetical protein